MPISSMSLQDAREAINEMAESFQTLQNICRSLDKNDQRRLFNAVTFGPISQFLGCANGYEPAFPGNQFTSAETLLEMLENDTEFDDEDLTDDDEVDLIDVDDEIFDFTSSRDNCVRNGGHGLKLDDNGRCEYCGHD